MASGWYEPVPLNQPAASWLASGCSSSQGFHHLGRDFGAPVGTSVRAIGYGRVVANASFGNGFGRALFVQHTSAERTTFTALYGHVKNAVAADTIVTPGQVIAQIDHQAAGPHLHLGGLPGLALPATNWGRMSCPTGNGTNRFANPLPLLTTHPTVQRSRSDFNGDGRSDLAAFHRHNGNIVNLWTWYGQPDGTVTSPFTLWSASGWDATRIMPAGKGDFNGDNNIDIATFYRHDAGTMNMNIW